MSEREGSEEENEKRMRGRPRDPAVEEAVFMATIESLSADGYGRISIGDISRKSGITRPTIYLRWKNLHDLVVDALDWYASGLPAPEPHGDELVDALKAALNMMVPEEKRDLGLGIVGHLIADARQHPDLLKIVQDRMITPYRKSLIDILQRYMDEGRIKRDVAPDVLVDLMMGSFFALFMNTGDISTAWADKVANTFWSILGEEQPAARAPDLGMPAKKK